MKPKYEIGDFVYHKYFGYPGIVLENQCEKFDLFMRVKVEWLYTVPEGHKMTYWTDETNLISPNELDKMELDDVSSG